jgi:hypothetical protein
VAGNTMTRPKDSAQGSRRRAITQQPHSPARAHSITNDHLHTSRTACSTPAMSALAPTCPLLLIAAAVVTSTAIPAGSREFRSSIFPAFHRKACIAPAAVADSPTTSPRSFTALRPAARLILPPKVGNTVSRPSGAHTTARASPGAYVSPVFASRVATSTRSRTPAMNPRITNRSSAPFGEAT